MLKSLSRKIFHISLVFGLVCLILNLLAAVGFFLVYSKLGIGFSVYSVVRALVSYLPGILIAALIIAISFLVIKKRLQPNRLITIGARMFSVLFPIMLFLVVIRLCELLAVHTSPAVFDILTNIHSYVSVIIYPLLPISFFTAIGIYAAGYIQDRWRASPRRYEGIALVVASLAIIVLLDLIPLLLSITRMFAPQPSLY
jgi:hypothetical protein